VLLWPRVAPAAAAVAAACPSPHPQVSAVPPHLPVLLHPAAEGILKQHLAHHGGIAAGSSSIGPPAGWRGWPEQRASSKLLLLLLVAAVVVLLVVPPLLLLLACAIWGMALLSVLLLLVGVGWGARKPVRVRQGKSESEKIFVGTKVE